MYTVMQKKNCVFIAAILSELHAPWQPVMQGFVIGLTTLNLTWHCSSALASYLFKFIQLALPSSISIVLPCSVGIEALALRVW